MKDITSVDKNFIVKTTIGKEDVVFYDIKDESFKVHGIKYEDGMFRRITKGVAEKVSDGVEFLHSNTAGGRVRFKTNSPYVVIVAKYGYIGHMSHFTVAGSVGFDMYVKKNGVDEYYGSYIPSLVLNDKYEGVHDFADSQEREITINLPLYSDVCEMYVGLSKDAMVSSPSDYKCKEYIVYYGSSITQGGCASRPGNSYQAMISRRLDCDYLNLGFSGSAKAEDEMIDYIKKLDMSLFVYDYDHNAPSAEHLEKTHEKMFKAIREAHPDLPIIMMPKPKFFFEQVDVAREKIIRKTYDNAIAAGDKNVYYITNTEIMRIAGNNGTVDGCHPNDLGFFSMASAIGDVIEKIIAK